MSDDDELTRLRAEIEALADSYEKTAASRDQWAREAAQAGDNDRAIERAWMGCYFRCRAWDLRRALERSRKERRCWCCQQMTPRDVAECTNCGKEI